MSKQTTEPGVYPMIRVHYDLLPRYNQSLLKKWEELCDVPGEFAYWRAHRHEEKESEALRLGRALDCWKLEYAEFKHRFFIVPDGAPKKPTKAQINAKKPSKEAVEAIAYWKELSERSKGKSILSCAEIDAVAKMADALNGSESARGIFESCWKAVLIADIFGFPCKGEVDLWDHGRTEHIWDLKQLRDVSKKGFKQAFFDYGYDIQATFYLALARALGFDKRILSFVCVKNTPPYTVKVYSFAPYDNEKHAVISAQASRRIGNAIEELDRRLKTNDFTDDQDWKLIEIDAWRLRQAQMETAEQ